MAIDYSRFNYCSTCQQKLPKVFDHCPSCGYRVRTRGWRNPPRIKEACP